MILTIASLVAGVLCVIAYARSERLFAWANATLWPIVSLDALLAGALGSALLAGAFGVVGVWKLWRGRRLSYATPVLELHPTPEQQSVILKALADAGGPILYKEKP